MQVIEILQELLKCKSVTPDDDGAIDFIASYLQQLGFDCKILEFADENSYLVKNLYARFGKSSPNFCFAGHTDVVPIGDVKAWKFNPFIGEIHEGKIYGRGVVDMKGALASMLAATSKFLESHQYFDKSISFLITGDEEALAINGTKKVLETIYAQGEKIDACLVGEPTNSKVVGDTIKVGRRGSISFTVTINGVQGHVAYPNNSDNPITYLVKLLNKLKEEPLDTGSQFFEPSNLEITSIDVGNKADNVIPAHATAQFNIRFNDRHSPNSLVDKVKLLCDEIALGKYNLIYRIGGESFITNATYEVTILQEVIEETVGKKAELSTKGGTSDARFIKNYTNVIEFGLTNETAHKVDEGSTLKDIENLTEIYYKLLKKYFVIS